MSDSTPPVPLNRPKLAAVVFTDVVGYSTRMQRDEAAAIALVQADFERMRTLCALHGGELLNTMGDGMMLCFPSAVQAVSFALRLQDEFGARKAALPPEQALEHRVGVHLGDVFRLENGSVAGDGVNIASRLEAKAPPGGICISQTVYDTVKGKVPMQATSMGLESFKNITEPIPVWHVRPEGTTSASDAGRSRLAPKGPRRLAKRWLIPAVSAVLVLAIAAGGWLWSRRDVSASRTGSGAVLTLADGKSIAVLPFTNMSADKDNAYFADGMHEELLTQLALLGELKVVSRTSVMDYRDSKKNMRQIGTELGVNSLVEGSVRRAGNQVRVTAQLIDAGSDKHLWAATYDRELKDIFAIQSELATEIAKALKVTLSPKAEMRIAARPTDNLEAYEIFLRAQELYNRSQGTIRVMSTIKDRIALLSKAVQLDPRFAHAWARLAVEHGRAYYSAVDKTPERQAQAKEAMNQALALAPDDLLVKIAEGDVFTMALSDYGAAARAYEAVLQSAPHNVDALNGLASVYRYQGRIVERVSLIERALAVEPRNFGALQRLKAHYTSYRYYDRALTYQQKLMDLRPDDVALQAEYHRIEFYRTGTWTNYDAWRSKLPAGAERKYSFVHLMDLNRAIAHRDYAEILRLADVTTEDERDAFDTSQKGIFRNLLIAITFHAKGDRMRATESARVGLRLVETEIKNRPKDWSSWQMKSWSHALLGQRDLAAAAHAQATAVAKEEGGTFDEDQARRYSLALYTLLGNRKEALSEMLRQLKLPDSHVHEFRVSIELADLWDDPAFKAIVNDPANNAPLPFNLQDRASTRK